MKNKGRSAVITGGAGTIGRAIASNLLGQGYRVYLLDLSDAVMTVAQDIGAPPEQARGRIVDVADISRLVDAARWCLQEEGGACDALVNCAGISLKKNGAAVPLTDISLEQWDRVHRINLTAPFIMCREMMPPMAEQGFGRVVNIASRTSRDYVPAASLDYHSSKSGMMGLTRALAGAYGPKGVTVNSVAPGRIVTAMARETSPELLAETRRQVPVGRLGDADDVAGAVSYLISDAASYVNGACIDVNGGIYMT